MSLHPSHAFQQLLQARLVASPGLIAASAPAYDNVPADAAMPYVCHGGGRCETEHRLGGRAFRLRHVVEAYDDRGGRAGLLALHDAIDRAVSLPPPSSNDLIVDRWAVEESAVTLLADGRTWRGTTTITARVRPTTE